MRDQKKLNEEVMRKLKDTNCSEDLMGQILLLMREEKVEAQLRLIQVHRAKLFEKVRLAQKDLDLLDYFIYEMRQSIR